MDPQIGKAGFRIAVFLVVTALGLLLIVPRGSAEFFVTVITLIIALLFMVGLAILIRRSLH